MKMMDRAEAARVIERFISERSDSMREWDDFISARYEDPLIQYVASVCAQMPQKYPPRNSHQYCNEEADATFRELIAKLKC